MLKPRPTPRSYPPLSTVRNLWPALLPLSYLVGYLYFGVLYLLGMRIGHLRVRSVGPIPTRNA